MDNLKVGDTVRTTYAKRFRKFTYLGKITSIEYVHRPSWEVDFLLYFVAFNNGECSEFKANDLVKVGAK